MDGASVRGLSYPSHSNAASSSAPGPGSASASEHGGEEEWEKVSVCGSASDAGDREVDAVLDEFMMVGIGEDDGPGSGGTWDRLSELDCNSMPSSTRSAVFPPC